MNYEEEIFLNMNQVCDLMIDVLRLEEVDTIVKLDIYTNDFDEFNNANYTRAEYNFYDVDFGEFRLQIPIVLQDNFIKIDIMNADRNIYNEEISVYHLIASLWNYSLDFPILNHLIQLLRELVASHDIITEDTMEQLYQICKLYHETYQNPNLHYDLPVKKKVLN